MKRLTVRELDYCAECDMKLHCAHYDGGFPACEESAIYDRLAAIEDILGDEYDLDRFRELKQADDEGRCGIPPVRLHQHIFRIFSGEIREETVCDAMWEPFTPRPRWKVWVMGSGLPYYWNDVFGKTVFLTRAEAEAALEGIKNG